jgi:hypothetical protein
LDLGHVSSSDPEKWQSYDPLLQSAFVLVQLLERGSLLRRLAAEWGRPFWELFGSRKDVARRRLDRVRFVSGEEGWLDARPARQRRIRLDSW